MILNNNSAFIGEYFRNYGWIVIHSFAYVWLRPRKFVFVATLRIRGWNRWKYESQCAVFFRREIRVIFVNCELRRQIEARLQGISRNLKQKGLPSPSGGVRSIFLATSYFLIETSEKLHAMPNFFSDGILEPVTSLSKFFIVWSQFGAIESNVSGKMKKM